jgi:hypothetical protein
MAVSGSKRENTGSVDFVKKVGFFEGRVIAINPTPEEFKSVLGIDLPEDSKSAEYLGVSSDGTTKVRASVWLEDVKTGDKFNVGFFMEDNKRANKDGTKKQYINNIGIATWADSEDNLPTWFTAREYRVAYVGEAEFVELLRTWLGGLNFKDESSELMLDWKKIIKGNFKEWKDEIGGDFCQTVGALATVRTVDKEDGPKSYQGVYNKAFFPGYSIKYLRLVDYNDQSVIRTLSFKKSKELKMHERFILNVVGEYGCKDFYTFKELHDYNPEDNLVESDKAITSDGDDY